MLLKLSRQAFIPVSNGQTTTETTTKSFSRFINGSGTLNQFAINYPLQEVLEDISHYVSEDQLKDYEEQYYLLYTMREINSIMSLNIILPPFLESTKNPLRLMHLIVSKYFSDGSTILGSKFFLS